ncbi:MAG: glutaredoxin family protein [Acidobacteria bacterium]|nr:glutaredoxin family protein [Acidobacteriota bacterium]
MTLTLYSKPGCHLCDDMKAIVAPVARRFGVEMDAIDISGDAELMKEYGQQIPVLLLDGRKIAKYRISEAELRRCLECR